VAKNLHVLIAGGGLSGLCLAQGVLKDGNTCEVFERDADPRRSGYYLNINGDGGEALRRCLPSDLYELYRATSRATPERSESIVLDDQLNELSSQPHLGPPNEGPDRHTGVNRRTLRQILLARLGQSFRAGVAVESYEEDADGVTVHLSDGSTARGDVLVGADGIRSVVRGERLPEVQVVEAGINGLGVYARTPLTPQLAAVLPHILFQGVIIAADHFGSRALLSAFQPRKRPDVAGGELQPAVDLEPVDDYFMVSCSVARGTVIPRAREWTNGTPAMLRDAMVKAVEGWDPAIVAIVSGMDLDSIFVIPFGRLDPPEPWKPSRVTLIGDAAHAMLPTLGMGANLALRDSGMLAEQLRLAGDGELGVVEAIAVAEDQMRDYAYPFVRATMDHDHAFGGGALESMETAEG
jgi:2-polyprenyl-6-methoxyphenol hydroxylase-like FAD-dependent oxidoreductase